MDKIEKRKNLDEVSFIRPILIILLVAYHAFAPWCGAWVPFEGYTENETYFWIAKTSYSFMLPMFVFISGYVWGYQREILRKNDTFKTLVQKKFSRLYVPAIVFGLLFYAIFTCDYSVISLSQLAQAGWLVIQGYKHMWFLPMLFWCFIVLYMILKIRNEYMKVVTLGFLFALCILPFPFQIESTFYYLPFFYLGYKSISFSDRLKKYSTPKNSLIMTACFIVVFVLGCFLSDKVSEYIADQNLVVKYAGHLANRMISVCYGTLGIYMLLFVANGFSCKHQLSGFILNIGNYCFGVYIFQQFLLYIVYYYSATPCYVSSNALPWIGFIIALLLSLALSWGLRQTKIGKRLI